jgi:hypothetical protein
VTPCRPCQGSGARMTTVGWVACSMCAGSGKSQYRTIAAMNRRQAYLQQRGDSEGLVAEGFPALEGRICLIAPIPIRSHNSRL